MSRDFRPAGTLVLDSEGLSKVVRRDLGVAEWLALARADDLRVVTSAVTLVEVMHPGMKRAALEWALSRMRVEPVTGDIARRAAAILGDAGLHGHKYAIDAILAATALSSPRPVVVLTSDPEDLALLCGPEVDVVAV